MLVSVVAVLTDKVINYTVMTFFKSVYELTTFIGIFLVEGK